MSSRVTGYPSFFFIILLDIRADYRIDGRRIILLVECKKNNPDFVNWIFLPKSTPNFKIDFACVSADGKGICRGGFGTIPVMVSDTGREVRGDYANYKKGDRTKTSNSAITDAATQISLATQAIQKEEELRMQVRADSSPAIIIPVIVTTAKLKLCEFRASDVSIDSGTIEFDNVNLRDVPTCLVYEYPLPNYLQGDSFSSDPIEAERFVRKHIVVVQSTDFGLFLANHALEAAEQWSKS